VVSCDLMQCELADIAVGAAVGQLCAASYFDSLASAENSAFKARVARAYGDQRRVSGVFASAYTAVKLCVEAILAADCDEPQAVRSKLHSAPWQSLFGPLAIDQQTNHAALPFHLGRINADNDFDVIASRPAIAADPYLTARHAIAKPQLRVVS
jgi:ABC-type branched-subunit amino acid transport system substrate-binding protein